VAKDEVAVAIRQHVINKHIEPARASGAKELTLRAGELHKELSYKNRMPAVCSVLGSKRLETEARVHRTSTRGPHNSSTTSFTYTMATENEVEKLEAESRQAFREAQKARNEIYSAHRCDGATLDRIRSLERKDAEALEKLMAALLKE
jgi:sirohydrochlorin ferrochelatase